MHQTPKEEEEEEEEIDAFQHGSTYVPHSIYKASLLDRFGFDAVKPWHSNSPNSGWTFLIREALCR
jgi:hypothetical protein